MPQNVEKNLSEKRLREFWRETSEAETAMREWVRTIKLTDWNNFSDVRKTFNHSDVFGNCVIFDVGGNKYRVIGKIAYRLKIVFVRFVMTHKNYDEKKWQSDCQ